MTSSRGGLPAEAPLRDSWKQPKLQTKVKYSISELACLVFLYLPCFFSLMIYIENCRVANDSHWCEFRVCFYTTFHFHQKLSPNIALAYFVSHFFHFHLSICIYFFTFGVVSNFKPIKVVPTCSFLRPDKLIPGLKGFARACETN